jgi:hypothetical protein
MPFECGYWPVTKEARLPEHVDAAAKALRNRIPWSASSWMFGVGIWWP